MQFCVSSFLSSPEPERLASHSDPVIWASISRVGGNSSNLVTRVSWISSIAVAPLIATFSFTKGWYSRGSAMRKV